MLPTLLLMVTANADCQQSKELWAGKVDTGRSIHLETVVDASPEELFKVWTTQEGIQKVLGPKLTIDPRLGGRYEVAFVPDIDPEGASQGTKGSRILCWDPPHALAFEWATFVTSSPERLPPGMTLPPMVTPAERAAMLPYPVWVEVRFEKLKGDRTRVRLESHGFRSGEKWDEALRYFWRNWALVLGRLGALYADRIASR